MRLTKRAIDALPLPEKGDRLFFDDQTTGFVLRVTAKGARVFLFQYWMAGKNHRLRLGNYGDLTPENARKLADQARFRVAGGHNPARERRMAMAAQAVQVEADRFTFAVLTDRWVSEGLKDRRERTRAEAGRALRNGLRQLSRLPADQIDAAAARRVVQAIASNHPTMARRTKSYARAAYNWARKHGLVTTNPFAGVAVDGRETPRERVLDDAELGVVWRAAGAMPWPWGPYFRLLLLTLQRREEVAGLRWDELTLDLSVWNLPGTRTKNGKAHFVHLVPKARAVIEAAPRHAHRLTADQPREASPFVFTTKGTTPISGFSKAKAALDAAISAARAALAIETGVAMAPLAPWRLHDLRRTGVTVMARLGVRWEVADRVLNHTTGAIQGVAAVYQRHDFQDERAAAMKIWADHVISVAGETRSVPNVVPFRRD